MSGRRSVMDKILVIAYGNPLRGDDGIAWQAAEALKKKLPASAQVICVHQLTPELAENLSSADHVIFVDACIEGQPGNVRCRPISAVSGEARFSHHLSPGEVLALCNRLYSANPIAFLISISGKSFDHGEQVTAAVVKAIPRAARLVESILKCRVPLSNLATAID